jgi:hypothetical protein
MVNLDLGRLGDKDLVASRAFRVDVIDTRYVLKAQEWQAERGWEAEVSQSRGGIQEGKQKFTIGSRNFVLFHFLDLLNKEPMSFNETT